MLLAPLVLGVVFAVPVCPTAALLRLPCPGCGLTRATLALAVGDVAGATAINPLAVLLCPLLGAAFVYAAYRYVRHGNVDADRWGAGPLLVVSMTALTAIWLLRWFGLFGGPVAV